MRCYPTNTLSIRPIYLSVVDVGTVHPPAEILVEWCWLAKDYPLATPHRFGAVGRWFALRQSGHLSFYEYTPYAARSGRDIQLTIGIAGSTQPSPATT